MAYFQWTRHLNYDPGQLQLRVGYFPDDPHSVGFGGNIAYYDPERDVVVLTESIIIDNYRNLISGIWFEDEQRLAAVIQRLFLVISHEAAHQFGYENPDGITEGCGGDETRCHAPYGSGSVASYDHLNPSGPRSLNYHVTEEDIRHIPDATWNDAAFDRYTISRSAAPSAIDRWGVWIDHYFEISGRTDPGRLSGGNLSIIDEIHGTGWVQGRPSRNVRPPDGATWKGENNFLGVDLDSDYLGALLRADANLRYTFGASPNLNLRVNNFEAHYDAGNGARWHTHEFPDWGDFSYDMRCTSDGCSSDDARARFYASDAGDPSGFVGGTVNDGDNSYVGSFVAEKD